MSGKSQFALLKTERFLPLFITQALSAFNDNAFRLALSMIILAKLGTEQGAVLNSISAALFILPFFLFSAFAGQLADKFDKALVAKRIKFVEIFIVATQVLALFSDNTTFAQACLFLGGVQAAFFGPIKYGILPQHLTKDELLGGNGMVEMATFVAVMAGTIFGTLLINIEGGKYIVAVVMISIAIISWLTARQIPAAPATQPDLKLNWNFASETWNAMKYARDRKEVFQAILGVSWFWVLGVVFATQIPVFTQVHLFGNENVATLIYVLFAVSTAAGSVYCNKLLDGVVSVKYVPIAALLMSLFMIDLYFAAGIAENRIGAAIANGSVVPTVNESGTKLLGLGTVLTFYSTWRVFFDLAVTAFISGIFVVPLFALMQIRTPYYKRARIVGSNNIYNGLFMVGATVISGILLNFGLTARGLFMAFALANLVVAVYIIRILPHDTLARAARFLFTFFYDVEVKGLEHYKAAGKKALIISNHTSLLDGPLLSAFMPERATFAIDTGMAKKWWVKPAFALVDLAPMDPGNPLAIRTLVRALKSGRKVMIFPEGRITTTGQIMKIYDGPGAIAEMAGGKILPVRIDGAQYSPFTRLKGLVPRKLFPKITITFLPPMKMEAPANLKGAALREHHAAKLYDVMTDMVFQTSNIDRTLWQALLDARSLHGGGKLMFEDIQRQPMSYDKLVLGAFVLGRKIDALTPGQKYVGVLLPNANAAVATVFGLHAFGKVPAMMNFSTGAVNMSAACTAAEVRTILTSRKFIEAGEMQDQIDLLAKTNKIVYLEDVRATVGPVDKVLGLLRKTFAGWAVKSTGASRDQNSPAVVLFTSGSEGLPKGVVLSHRNLAANCLQMLARIPFNNTDIFFSALPVFHAFGFVGGIILPMLHGIRSFLYPSPLHYKIVPELIYDTGATIFISTDTFLNGYARTAHPYDFHTVRYLVGGAERIKPETRALFSEKYGLRIIEGYGATECAPAISANTPMQAKNGTVGRIFSGMEHRIEPVPGIPEGGRLMIKGPNVMLGYLRADNPGVIEPPQDGWYDTGDIVKIDEEGYITIQGRAKRFSKIAGEMVSLTAIEMRLGELYPDFAHAVVGAPDKKKGEQLVMYTTMPNADRKMIATGLKEKGVSELMIPKTIIPMEVLPLLGSGKTDYVTLNRMALDAVAE
jgi:acyl-[acyl-carrier-protein]-phospholipid O-acyltransferase / long-chain-fatty-acid--[acyl-carrier-protein] ligase